jgi:hypothetical protein
VASCSSPDLEPGPLELLDETAIVGPPEPPTFTPIAHEFASSNGGIYAELDAVSAIFDAEAGADLFGDVAGAIGSVASSHQAVIDSEALANLEAAEDGFRVARDKTAALRGNVPPDVQQPQFFSPLNFFVHDAAGVGVAGALIRLDADFGNGSTRSTDGNGLANFGAATQGSVSFTVTRDGYQTASGVVALGNTAPHDVLLQAA